MANYKHVQKAVSLIATLVLLLTTVFSPVYAAEPEPPVTGAVPGISAVKGAATLSAAMPEELIGASAVALGWSAIDEGGTDYASVTPGSTAISFSLGEVPVVTGDTKVHISIGADVPVGRYKITARDITSAVNSGNAADVVVLDIVAPAIGTSTAISGIDSNYLINDKLGTVTITVAAASGSAKPSGTVELFCQRPGESKAKVIPGGSAVLADGAASIAKDLVSFDKVGNYVFSAGFIPNDSSVFSASTSAPVEVSVYDPTINIISISPISAEKVSNTDSKFNQSAITVSTGTNSLTAKITVNKPLNSFVATGTDREKLGSQQWIGLLVTTNVEVSQLYYGTTQAEMLPLGESAVQEAANLGVQGSKTFVIWTKSSDYTAKNGYSISRFIRNGAKGTVAEIKLEYVDFVAPAITCAYAAKSNADAPIAVSQQPQPYKLNQNAVTVWSNTYVKNYLNINIQANSSLQDYKLAGGDEGKWVGILVTTDVNVTDLYLGSSSVAEGMKKLTQTDINTAKAYGATGDKTFLIWVKTQEFKDGSAARYIKNGEYGTVVKLNLNYIPPAIGTVHVSAITKERVTDASSKQNQSTLSVLNTSYNSGNKVNTAITANGRLEVFGYDFEYNWKPKAGRWIGLLVTTTDTDVTDLYYGTSPNLMSALTAEDIHRAVALGATGTKTFVLWLDADELKENGTVARYIKNGENGIPKELNFTLIHNHIIIQDDSEVYTLDKGSVEAAAYTNVTDAKVRFTAVAKDDSGKLISANSFIAMQTAAPVSVVNEKATIKYTALKEGKVTVTAELVDASGRSFYPPIKEACNLSIKPSAVVDSLDIVDNVVVDKLTLDKGVAADGTVYYGSKKLQAMVYTKPDSEHFKAVTWKSSNEKVAKVDADGLVTAVGAGSADIIATTNYKNASGSYISKKVVVTVKQHLTGASLSMGVNKNSDGQYILIKGDNKLGASVPTKLMLSDAASKDVAVNYTSSDNNIVKVSGAGVITAVGAGEATVTAAVNEKVAPGDLKLKKLFETQIRVKVYGSLVNTIALQKEGNGCLLNDSTVALDYLNSNKFTLSAAVNENTYNAVAFSYSGPSSIYVRDNGNNTATITVLDSASGMGTITARALDGSNKQASVKVTTGGIPVAAVTIASGKVTVGVGKSVSLTAMITPPEATNKTLKWVSSNPDYVTVDQKGVLKGIQPTTGDESIKVTAYATDGSGCSAQVDVKVSAATSSVAITAVEDLGKGIIYISKNDTVSVDLKDTPVAVQLKPAPIPDSASKEVIWKSSDSKVASVGPDGAVTVNAKGKATITATTTDGSGKSDTIQLVATQKVYGILLKEPAKSEHDLNGNVLAKSGTSVTPAVTFNNGTAATAPANSGYKLEVAAIPEDSGSTYITISKDGKSFIVAPNALPGCYFQIKAASTENTGIVSQPLTFKTVSAKGELTAVEVKVPTSVYKDQSNNNILLVGKSVTLSALYNQGKSLPSGITCAWNAYEADNTGAYTSGQSEMKNLITATGVLVGKDSGNIGKCIAVEVTAKQGSSSPVSNHAIFKVYSPVQGMKINLPVNGGKLAYGGTTRAVWVCKNGELGDKGYCRNVVWTTSNPLVADVQPDADGCNIIAVGKGTATITVTALDGSGAKATATVTVGPATVPVNKLELNYTKVALKPKESLDVTAVLSAKPPIPGASITDNGVIWSIKSAAKGKDIANFGKLDDGTPVLQIIMPSGTNPRTIKVYAGNDCGTVTLTAKAKDGNGAFKSMEVVVADTGNISGIALSAPKSTAAVISGDSVTNGTPILLRGKSLKLNAQITPANAINKTLSYSVTDIDGKAVSGVTVDAAGNVKADNKAGAGYILVKAAATDGSGKTDTIKLYVAPAATAIQLSPENPSVKPGESLILVANGENCDKTACSIKWVSRSPSIAWFTNNITKSGEQNYLTIAKDVGTTASVTIDVCATDGSGKLKTITVKLGAPVEKIMISNSACKNPTLQDGACSTIPGDSYPQILLQGKSMQFTASVTPSSAPNKSIVYSVEPVDNAGQTHFEFNGVTIDKKSGLLKVTAPTAKGATVYQGFVKVTARATDKVTAAESNPIYVYIAPVTKKVAILPATLTGEPNRFYELSALAAGAGDCSGAVAWKSSNPSVASLNKAVTFSGRDSVILTIAANAASVKSVVITATMLDGTNVSASLTVNIGKRVTEVTIKPTAPVIHNGSTLQLSAETYPAIPVTPGVNWEITKGKELGVAIDDKGKLSTQKMVKNGTITVVAYAKDNNGALDMLDLDVRQYVTSVAILKDEKPVKSNVEILSTDKKGIQFTANASGPSADYKPFDNTVTWLLSTADQKYAAVDQTGLVTLTPEGTKVTSNGRVLTVTAKANDGSGKFAAVKVVIKFQKA
ncbi:Ig-like domain-containing protein [Acetanaerobacterium elongatum]|uniref:Ig-like domain (Group 2) n=1 Tax=Acetanaerobacterium elongatum TaxID=258515 RepID=A0A1H0AIS0_9FIRM|nr:Ig-like domain-containing protein [Acetanaerobacterium elongatum]SDN33498.1 Ig-like domain (group 2) [Acetanaerobacterium elongatum]